MPNQATSISKLDQLPEAARDRIEQLQLLFVERSKGHLAEIHQVLDERRATNDRRASDTALIKLAHSLVGASGIFGFQDLGNAAFEVESILGQTRYSEADFNRVLEGLIGQLKMLD
jgi:HPt (histidine-containing phosphotransfer) domain-containing protein